MIFSEAKILLHSKMGMVDDVSFKGCINNILCSFETLLVTAHCKRHYFDQKKCFENYNYFVDDIMLEEGLKIDIPSRLH